VTYLIHLQILLSRLTFFKKGLSGSKGLQGFKETAEAVMCGLIPSSPTATSSRTDGTFLTSHVTPFTESLLIISFDFVLILKVV